MDDRLNDLAQKHSNNQIANNFFGHYDPQGKGPSDRAKDAGIMEVVGENVALNSNLTEAQLSLQRSAGHLRNMVRPSWTRVGLGIAQGAQGGYYLTQ
jgi:uncharacterized protein YkwD